MAIASRHGMSRTTVGWHTSSQGLLHDSHILSFSQLVTVRNWDMLELCLLQKSSFITSLSSRIDAESLDFHLIPSHVCRAFCLATVNSPNRLRVGSRLGVSKNSTTTTTVNSRHGAVHIALIGHQCSRVKHVWLPVRKCLFHALLD